MKKVNDIIMQLNDCENPWEVLHGYVKDGTVNPLEFKLIAEKLCEPKLNDLAKEADLLVCSQTPFRVDYSVDGQMTRLYQDGYVYNYDWKNGQFKYKAPEHLS